MLERVWRKANSLTLLVGMQTGLATMENSVKIPLKTGNRTAISSVQFTCSVMSDSLRPHGSQHARPPCPSPTPRVYPNSCPLSWWCHSAISSSVVLFSSSQHQGLFQWVNSPHEVAKVLEFQLQHQSFQWIFRTYFFYDWLIFCSLTPQFTRINSLALSFLYGPTLTSILDYWRNHSFD